MTFEELKDWVLDNENNIPGNTEVIVSIPISIIGTSRSGYRVRPMYFHPDGILYRNSSNIPDDILVFTVDEEGEK